METTVNTKDLIKNKYITRTVHNWKPFVKQTLSNWRILPVTFSLKEGTSHIDRVFPISKRSIKRRLYTLEELKEVVDVSSGTIYKAKMQQKAS